MIFFFFFNFKFAFKVHLSERAAASPDLSIGNISDTRVWVFKVTLSKDCCHVCRLASRYRLEALGACPSRDDTPLTAFTLPQPPLARFVSFLRSGLFRIAPLAHFPAVSCHPTPFLLDVWLPSSFCCRDPVPDPPLRTLARPRQGFTARCSQGVFPKVLSGSELDPKRGALPVYVFKKSVILPFRYICCVSLHA